MARKTDDLARLQRRQKFLKEKIEQARVLAEGASSPFWKNYKQICRDKLAAIERALDGFETLTNEQIRVSLATRKNLKLFISAPDDFAKSLEMMEEGLEKIKAKIDGRKSSSKL